MLFGHRPHILQARRQRAGLGRLGRPRRPSASSSVAAAGANAIGVISEESKRDFVLSLGAKGVINRKDFNCWGQMPKVNTPEYNDWMKEARKFGKAIWDITGKQRCRHRVRASGRADLPGLLPGGQARRHGGVLRRHHRLQPDLRRALRLDAPEAHPGQPFRQSQAGQRRQPAVLERRIDPVHVGGVPLERHPARAHEDAENQHKPGNMAVLVKAPRAGRRTFEEAMEAWRSGAGTFACSRSAVMPAKAGIETLSRSDRNCCNNGGCRIALAPTHAAPGQRMSRTMAKQRGRVDEGRVNPFEQLYARTGDLLKTFGQSRSLLRDGDFSVLGYYWGHPQIRVSIR